MKTIKLSTISHVVDVKFNEGLRGGAYYDIINNGKKMWIQPHVSGWRRESAAIFHDGKCDIVVGDVFYKGGLTDAGPSVRMNSEEKPATELYKELGFAIDLNN